MFSHGRGTPVVIPSMDLFYIPFLVRTCSHEVYTSIINACLSTNLSEIGTPFRCVVLVEKGRVQRQVTDGSKTRDRGEVYRELRS